jgi:hypothetical protein
VAVENRQLTVEADGAALLPNAYTSTSPRFTIRLPGAARIDTAHSHITLDETKVSGAVVSLLPETVSGEPAVPGAPAGVTIRLAGLSEGAHVLRAYLEDPSHVRGETEIHFRAAPRLRIDAARISPNPARESARLTFTLTRPAVYRLELYDISGRRVQRLGEALGLPAENEVHFGGNAGMASLSPGVYFYVLSARFESQRATTRGRVVVIR